MPHGSASHVSQKFLDAFDLTRNLKKCKVLKINGNYYIIGTKLAEHVYETAGGTHYPFSGGLFVRWNPGEEHISIKNELYSSKDLELNGLPSQWGAKEKFAAEVVELKSLLTVSLVLENLERFEELVCSPDDWCHRYFSIMSENFAGIELTDEEIIVMQLHEEADEILSSLKVSDKVMEKIRTIREKR